MTAETVSVLSDVACHLGEGITYDPVRRAIVWFDIVQKVMFTKRDPDGPVEVQGLPLMTSALAVVDGDRDLLVCEDGLHLRARATGRMDRHVAVEADDAVTRSNDARVHPSGSLWFGTMGRNAERKAGAIYWYRKGEVRRLYPEITIPNSICFSPDGRIAYFADTGRNIVFRVDCDPATGLPSGEPHVFLDHRGKPGGVDGSVTDAEGVVWNARWGSGRVDAYAPDGMPIRSIPMPATQVSCPAFVGERLDRLCVTSAWQGMDDQARAADPNAGRTFLVEASFRGRSDPPVAL